MLDQESPLHTDQGAPVLPTDPSVIADAIDIPLSAWPGNCHAIAEAVLRHLPTDGVRLVRGHYTGPVSERSVYGAGCGLQQHSWLRLGDGRILDPTRWAMASPERPFIYLGENDAYDEAGLEAALQSRPYMAMSLMFSGKGQERGAAIAESLNRLPQDLLADLALAADLPALEVGVTSQAAERLLDLLSDPVEHLRAPEALYGAAGMAGLKAFIKIDNWIRVMEPEQVTPRASANLIYADPPCPERSSMQKLFRVFENFLSIEARENTIDRELAEYGYKLDDLHHALNWMERCLRDEPDLPWMPAGDRDLLCVVSSDLLGKGFGQELRVERFADSIGLDRAALHRALIAFSEPAGFDAGWLIGAEAQAAMAIPEGDDADYPAPSF